MTFQMNFTVEGTPVGKGRPKFARRGNFVSTYTPTKTRNYEDIIKAAATQAMTEPPITAPLRVFVYIDMPVPVSYSKKRKEACLAGAEHPTKKPDIDNVAKCFLDAMNGIVYVDDSQVVSLHITKVYGTVGMVEVVVREELQWS
jgi:Holliday junction resolvase RusA-like endonuclease